VCKRTFLNDVVSESTLVKWTQDFVRHASPQTRLFETEPTVLAFVDKVGHLLDDLGLPYRRDEMGNLIAEIGPSSAHSVMLMTYAMTHPASNMAAPYGGEIIQIDAADAIRGRGVSEQKGSLAAALAATYAAYRSGNLTGRLVFAVSTAGETGRHDAALAVLRALTARPTAAIVVIGTTGRVALGNKGRIDVLITVKGRPAHSSTPWEGLDAVAGAREVMKRLDTLAVGSREHEGLGKATLAVTSIHSFPEATHTIQGEVQLVYDRRLLPGDSPHEALAQIKGALAKIGQWQVNVTPGPEMYPSEVAADSRLIDCIRRGCHNAGLPAPAFFHSHGSLDAGLFTKEGIEATMWGPGNMDQWHSDDEYILVSDLKRGAAAYYAFLREYLMR
jgi:acetylornithine deacetylase